MKKQITLIIGAFLYSLLFYENSFGINVVLFSLVAIASVAIFNYVKFKQQKTLVYSGVYLLASILFFINNTSLALVTTIFSFFVFLGTVSEAKSSIYIKFLNGFFSTIVSSFYHHFNRIEQEVASAKKREINYVFWSKIIGIPMLVVTVFVILYRSANPVFDDILNQINFDFINFQWFVFALLGYFLLLNIIHPATVEPITIDDISTANTLLKNELKEQSNKDLIQENQLGIVLLAVLNILIVFFLVTDAVYLNGIKDITAPSLSKTVHEGIYALITSIAFAIFIILYFFRGNLNFYEKNKTLKGLTILWIGLNILLIFTTNYKNYLYTSHFGLTYKRIGVFVYLLLALIGLVTTFLKVQHQYNLWFLLRKNFSVAFAMLVLASALNWDALITKYNINYAEITDVMYLSELKNNTLLLKDYLDENKSDLTAQDERLIQLKYEEYSQSLVEKKWQELTYETLKEKL